MRKIIKICVTLILTLVIFFQINIVYAKPEVKMPDGTYTNTGTGGSNSEQNKKEDTSKQDNNKDNKSSGFSDIFSLGEKFLQEGKQEVTKKGDTNELTINEEDIRKDASSIFNILFIIGTVLTVLVGGILGIKFMFAGIEEKAKIKEALVPYILGCIVIFGSVLIWRFVVTVLDQI